MKNIERILNDFNLFLEGDVYYNGKRISKILNNGGTKKNRINCVVQNNHNTKIQIILKHKKDRHLYRDFIEVTKVGSKDRCIIVKTQQIYVVVGVHRRKYWINKYLVYK